MRKVTEQFWCDVCGKKNNDSMSHPNITMIVGMKEQEREGLHCTIDSLQGFTKEYELCSACFEKGCLTINLKWSSSMNDVGMFVDIKSKVK